MAPVCIAVSCGEPVWELAGRPLAILWTRALKMSMPDGNSRASRDCWARHWEASSSVIDADNLIQRSTLRRAIFCHVQVKLVLFQSLKYRLLLCAVCNSETYQECVDGENATLAQRGDMSMLLVHAWINTDLPGIAHICVISMQVSSLDCLQIIGATFRTSIQGTWLSAMLKSTRKLPLQSQHGMQWRRAVR